VFSVACITLLSCVSRFFSLVTVHCGWSLLCIFRVSTTHGNARNFLEFDWFSTRYFS